jgi:hypothetical protein
MRCPVYYNDEEHLMILYDEHLGHRINLFLWIFTLDQFTLLILYIAVISTFIINKLKKVMESVKDFKDQLAANNQLVQAATGKLTDAWQQPGWYQRRYQNPE